jgi:hypothetical protein
MTRLYLGTASVLNGQTTVTITAGDPLNAANCPPDASVILGALPGHVASRTSTTQFELARPYAGVDGSVPLTIDPLTPEATSLVNLTVLAARVQAQLNVLDANSQGLFYTLLGVTGAADPGPGRIAFNNADPVSITAFYIDPIDANGRPVGGLIGQWEAGTALIVRSLTTTAYVALSVTQAVELSGGYYPGLAAYLDHDGTIAADEAVSITWIPGAAGLAFDHAVDNLAGRAAYDAAAAGTRVLVADTGAGRAAIYVKRAGAGIWSAPAYIEGPQGDQGDMPELTFLPAVTAAPGAPAELASSPVAGGYEVEFTLPQGLPGVDGKFSGTEVVKTADFTLGAGDSGKTIIVNKATAVLGNIAAAATLGTSWMAILKNIGAGTLTLDPNGAETIDGVGTLSLTKGQSAVIASNGTEIRSLFLGGASGAVTTKTATYTVTAGDAGGLIKADATAGAMTINLPAASDVGSGFEVTIKKTDASRSAVTIDPFAAETIDGAATFVLDEQYEEVTVKSDGAAWVVLNYYAARSRNTRETLTADRTYFVRTDGSDSNPGLTNTSGGAKLTIQAAINAVASLDLSIYNVTIQVGNGTYTAGATVSGPWVGSGTVTLQGDTPNPSNVLISTSGHCIRSTNSATIEVAGIKFASSGAAGVFADYAGFVKIAGKCDFGACGHSQVWATSNGRIAFGSSVPVLVSGASPRHIFADVGGVVTGYLQAYTVSGTPNFIAAWCVCSNGTVVMDAMTVSGAATGKRYDVTLSGVILTYGGGANYFPGNAAGTFATGGQYA